MGKFTSVDVIMGVLYVSAVLFLCITAYQLFIKRFKRNKLESLSAVSFITSKENVFSQKTSFLIVSAKDQKVKVQLLNRDESVIDTLMDETIPQEEYPFDFHPQNYEAGKYYLYLTTDNAKILRRITIVK
ncbi:MAG: hypothetical protein WDZ35_06980 [Crocinitomicaceae bacterium]